MSKDLPNKDEMDNLEGGKLKEDEDSDEPKKEVGKEDLDSAMEKRSEEGDKIQGGLADDDQPDEFDVDQLLMGLEVELEHTDDPMVALEIAMDHLAEIPDYYARLKSMEADAKGEGEKCMHGVLNVIMNRSFGDFRNARNVALDPSQFSVWNKVTNPMGKSINIKNQCQSKTIEGCEMYPIAVKLVDNAMKNQLVDITKGALFFYNPYKVRPSWANEMTKTITIGNHRFCKPKK